MDVVHPSIQIQYFDISQLRALCSFTTFLFYCSGPEKSDKQTTQRPHTPVWICVEKKIIMIVAYHEKSSTNSDFKFNTGRGWPTKF